MNSQARSERPFLPSDLSPVGVVQRAAFAAVVDADRGGSSDVLDVCRELYPNDRVVPLMFTRATATPGSTGTSGWASQIMQQATGAYFGSLPASAGAELIRRGLRVVLGGSGAIIPVRSGNPVALPWVEENSPIPVRVETIAPVTLTPKKMGLIVAFSRETARRSGAEEVIGTLLAEEATLSLDSALFSAAAATSSAHAGLLTGVAVTGTFGNMEDDLAALAVAAGTSGTGPIVFVTGPGRAASIAVRSPTLAVPVLGSLAVAEDTIVAIDAGAFVSGFAPNAEIEASAEGVIHMSDIASGSPVAGSPVRSLYQTDSIALRLIVDVAFAARRTGAVAVINGIYW